MKSILLSLLFVALSPAATLHEAERKAYEYGLMNALEFFEGDVGYQEEPTSKAAYIRDNDAKYITYVNVSIIEIAEEKAAKMKLKDYDGFVRQIRNEPNITLERVDVFRRNGNYIPEYEKYIKDKETKKTFIFW